MSDRRFPNGSIASLLIHTNRNGSSHPPHPIWTSPSATSTNSANGELPALVFYSSLAVLGTTVNIFQISALIIQDNLRRRGNVLLANQALANLLVTAVAFPASAIAILAGCRQDRLVCYWQWYSAMVCALASVVNFLLIALENAIRTSRFKATVYKHCCGVKFLVPIVSLPWLAAIACVVTLLVLGRSLDLCAGELKDTRLALFLLAPVAVTLVFFLKSLHQHPFHSGDLDLQNCRGSREEILKRHLVRSNVAAYILFLCFWLPFLLTLALASSASLDTLHTLLCVAQTYSCLCGLAYALAHDAFRQAFMYLVRYFCCKSHPEFTKSSYQEKPRGSVRVHIGMETRVGGLKGGQRTGRTLSSILSQDHCKSRMEEDFL